MMVTVLPFELPGKKESRQSGKEKIWAVVAMIGRKRKVASIHTSRDAALADCQWRREQVTAYARFLAEARDPAPDYHITLIYKGELPKGWGRCLRLEFYMVASFNGNGFGITLAVLQGVC